MCNWNVMDMESHCDFIYSSILSYEHNIGSDWETKHWKLIALDSHRKNKIHKNCNKLRIYNFKSKYKMLL